MAYGWTTYDANNDGETWDLGSNLWGQNPNYVHSGSDCLASISYSNYLGSITPDNWTLLAGGLDTGRRCHADILCLGIQPHKIC